MLVDARIRHELTPLAVLELVDELPTQVQRIKRTFHFLGTFVEKCYFIHFVPPYSMMYFISEIGSDEESASSSITLAKNVGNSTSFVLFLDP